MLMHNTTYYNRVVTGVELDSIPGALEMVKLHIGGDALVKLEL